MTETQAKNRNGKLWRAIIFAGLATVPLIYSGLLTGSFSDPQGNFDNIQAAVVNNDVATTTETTDGETKTVDLGDQLTEKLVDSDESKNFDWEELSADEAAEQLADGEVLAVLTIPEDFSANAVSPAGDDPKRAQLHIETNDAVNMFVGTIANQIGTVVADELATEVSHEYLTNIYAGFTSIHGSLQDAADGSEELGSGIGQAYDGAGELLVGINQLVSGTGELASGADTLASGADQAASGASDLASGAATLAAGAQQLSSGAQQAASGANELAAGTAELETQTSGLPDQAAQLDDGAQSLAAGAGQVADGTQQLADAVNGAASTAETVATVAEQLTTQGGELQTGASNVVTSLDDLATNWDTLTDDEKLALVTQIQTGAQQVQTGFDDAATSLEGIDLSSLDALQDPGAIVDQVNQLNDGAQQVATGAETLAGGTSQLRDASGTLVDGIAKVNSGAQQLADANGQLADGASALAGGTSTLASGANTLAGGTGELSDGADELADGAHQVSDGTGEAADGTSSLRDGLDQLIDGSGELTSGLEDGVDQVPSYSDSESETLADVTSNPVKLDTSRQNQVEKNADGMAPYFMSLALWVGGMAYFMMHEPLRKARGSGSILVDTLRAFLPGAIMGLVQSTLMLLVVHFLVGVDYALVWPVVGLAFLASVTFVAMNQALVALLGAPGRFLALVMIVLQLSSAGATYPVQTTPPFYQAIHPWLPLSYSVEAFRALIAGSTINVSAAVGHLLIWFAIALVGIAVAVWLERRKIAKLARDAGADAEVGEVRVLGGVNNVPNRASDGLGA